MSVRISICEKCKSEDLIIIESKNGRHYWTDTVIFKCNTCSHINQERQVLNEKVKIARSRGIRI